jgi:zinc protease
MRRRAGLGLLLAVATSASASMAEHGERATIDAIDVVTFRTAVKDVVVVSAALPGGDAFAPADNAAIPTLTGMMLDRGTRTADQFTIAAQLENVGAEISFNVGTQSLEIHAKCLKKDLGLVLGLIAADLRTPAFAPAEFAKAKQQLIGMLQASLQNSEARAQRAFARAVFAVGDPNYPHSIEEQISAAKSADLSAVKTFHARTYGPAHMTLVLAGDVSMEDVRAPIEKSFAGWSGGMAFLEPTPGATSSPAADKDAASGAAAGVVIVALPDKASVSVVLGQATGLRYRDPGALALRIGTAVLGRGFTGRLMGAVRDKEGLTYGIGAGVSDDSLTGGDWQLFASFAPSLLGRGIESSRRELQTWWQDGVSDAELAARKQELTGSYFVGLSTTAGVAAAVLATIERGYGLDWLDGYPAAIKALTRAEVNAAIRNHLNPASMVLVEAGTLPPPVDK